MNTIPLNQAETSLREIIHNVINDVERIIVTTETGECVVILSLDEYNGWREKLYGMEVDETTYLLSTEANRKRLMESIEAVNRGDKLIELAPTH